MKSPLDGRVGMRLVDPGSIVHASDPNGLVTVTQMQPIAVLPLCRRTISPRCWQARRMANCRRRRYPGWFAPSRRRPVGLC